MLKPFFSYYGSKFRAVRAGLYPHPLPGFPIIEPFCGSAAYACRYAHFPVWLNDIDPNISRVWTYLIQVSAAEILALPDVDLKAPLDVLPVHEEARLLIGWWLRRATAKPSNTTTRWGRARKWPWCFWGPEIRARLARQVEKIRHWTITNLSYENLPDMQATWFIDPPYEGRVGTRYQHHAIDYPALGHWIRARRDLTIACDRPSATYLPFRPLARIKSLALEGRSDEGVYIYPPRASARAPLLVEAPVVAPPVVLAPATLKTECPVCRERQIQTPRGVSCPSGHDGIEGHKIVTFSPSQLVTASRCMRMWVWERVYKYRKPKTEEQQTGDAIHTMLEGYAKTRVPPVDKRALEATRHIHTLWPNWNLRAENKFDFPLPVPGQRFTGFVDLLPTADPTHPEIVDYKTMKDLKWAKVEHELREDVQMLDYAHAAIALIPAPDAKMFRLRHIQIQTVKTVRSETVYTDVSRDHVEAAWTKHLKVIDQIEQYRSVPIKDVPLPKDGYGKQTCMAYGGCYHLERCAMVNAGVPVPHCGAPQPDTFRKETIIAPICPPDSTRRTGNDPPATLTTVDLEDLPKDLREAETQRRALARGLEESLAMTNTTPPSNASAFAQSGGPARTDHLPMTTKEAFLASAGKSNQAPVPATSAAPASGQPPKPTYPAPEGFHWAQTPADGSWYPRRNDAPPANPVPSTQAQPPPASSAPQSPPTSSGSNNAAFLASLKAPSAPPANPQAPVNPLAQALSDAKLASMGSDPLPSEESEDEQKRGPGRPKGSKNKTKDENEALVALTAQITKLNEELTQRTAERDSARNEALALTRTSAETQKNFDELAQIAQSLKSGQDAAITEAVRLRHQLADAEQLAAGTPATGAALKGFTLLIDVMPMKGMNAVHFTDFLAGPQETIRQTTGLDWRLHDYAKGATLLAEHVRQMEIPDGTILIVEEMGKLANAVLEVLIPRATTILRKV